MAKEGGEPRIWPYALVFLLLFAGAFWARKVDVSQRNSARDAAESANIRFEEEITATVEGVRTCLLNGRCDDLQAGFLSFGTADPDSVSDERWNAGMVTHFWPEFGAYMDGTLRWNAAVRTAVGEDLTVNDPAVLEQLLDGGEAERLTVVLAEARLQLAEREDRGRLLSRLFGWGWKLCLALMFVLPIAAGYIENRRHQRAQYAMWRRLQGRKTTPPVIAVGPDAT